MFYYSKDFLMKISALDNNYIAFNILKCRKKIVLFFFILICSIIPLYTMWAWLSCTNELMALTQCTSCLDGNGTSPWVDCSPYISYILPLWEWSCSHFQGIYDDCLSNSSSQWTTQCTGTCSAWEIWNTWSCKCVCDSSNRCCWIQLNTVVPFIWDCIELDTNSNNENTTSVNSMTAFPVLMQWLMKIMMSVIMVFSFIMVIVSWLMMTVWAMPKSSSFDKWKNIFKNVLISLILLWCSWLILSLINPSFFK